MSLRIADIPRIDWSAEEVTAWHGVPTAVVSDELNRMGTMDAGISSLTQDVAVTGPAFTVQTMAADNLAIHHAIAMGIAGCVLVIDAGGYFRNAVWGGILQRAAERAGIAGIVIDGYVRDVAELRQSKVPVFARGAVPAGPHKGWGGSLCETIQAGGCAVSPGDFIVADDDGVVVVPALRRQKVLRAAKARIQAEKEIIDQLETGRTTVDILGLE